jgi:hypothetical protein
MPGTEQFGSSLTRQIYVGEIRRSIADGGTEYAVKVFTVFLRQMAE